MPDYRKAARKAAAKYGVREDVFLRMLQQESGFNPNARSPVGASGIAQFMPATAKQYGVNLNDGRVSDDLDGAARYIRDNLKRTGGNYHRALSIYNSGKPEAFKDPGFAQGQTYNYVKKIMSGVGAEKDDPSGVRDAAKRKTQQQSDGVGARQVTTEVPGADRSDARKQLLLQYLLNRHDPAALVALGTGLKATQDVPSSSVTQTVQTSGAGAAPKRPAGKKPAQKNEGMSRLLELFWQGQGGINVKDGKKVPQGFVSGHDSHVHVAAGPKTVVKLGRLAQQMGLHVGENSKFTGQRETSGHAPNSNHYSDKAIDVSGDPAKMAAFAKRVAKMYGIKS